MIRPLLAGLVALGLSACVADSPPPATASTGAATSGPAALADRTAMDERAVLGFEVAVETAADLATLGIKAKLIKGANLDRVLDAVPKARAALAATRAAYRAGNRTSYLAATADVGRIVAEIRNLAKGNAL